MSSTVSTGPILLKSQTKQGELLQATFLPEKGMNLISLKKGGLEVIDQSTRPTFEERFAGLGALIGPHFYRRRPEVLPKIGDESRFPHIARIKAIGGDDPFSHGIGRYAPWKATATDTQVKATLTGKDTWNGVPLKDLEGQNFTMHFDAKLIDSKLVLNLSVLSDTDSLIGTHYYYHLPRGTGRVISAIQRGYRYNGIKKEIPSSWNIDSQNLLTFDLQQEADYTFLPFPNPREGKILLDAETYKLLVTYTSQSQENSWQLYHPRGASFVCIEPISAQDPHHPNLTVSSIQISIEINPINYD